MAADSRVTGLEEHRTAVDFGHDWLGTGVGDGEGLSTNVAPLRNL
jgi:hypothetical protein